MTPPTTFQWPLSPSGSFQFVRSLPLKRTVNPGSAGAAAGAPELHETRPARNNPSDSCFMDLSPGESRCRLLSIYAPAPPELGRLSGGFVVRGPELEELP